MRYSYTGQGTMTLKPTVDEKTLETRIGREKHL